MQLDKFDPQELLPTKATPIKQELKCGYSVKNSIGACAHTIIFIIFQDFLMVQQIFLSPQVKPSIIISNKHGIYDLLHKLPNVIRLRILRN